MCSNLQAFFFFMLAEVEELSVLLWLVESEQVRRSPGERFSENLLAVITPTPHPRLFQTS